MKFEEIADDWLRYKKASVKPSTYSNYYGVVQKRILSKFNGKTVKQLLKYNFNDYVESLINKRLGNKTIQDTVIILKQILKYAKAKYGFGLNIELINTPRLENKEVYIFNQGEYNQFKENLLESKNSKHLGMLIALFTRYENRRGLWANLERH